MSCGSRGSRDHEVWLLCQLGPLNNIRLLSGHTLYFNVLPAICGKSDGQSRNLKGKFFRRDEHETRCNAACILLAEYAIENGKQICSRLAW